MERIDWSDIDERELDAFHRRVALVETLIDGSIEETERVQVRHDYLREHGVCERTLGNYLKRYREGGAEGLLFHRRGVGPRSPRIYDEPLRAKILSLIEELPRRTVPQLRRLLTAAAARCDRAGLQPHDLPVLERAGTESETARGKS